MGQIHSLSLTPFLMRMKCEKIGVAPYKGCLLTLVEGIKPFVVRPGVKILTTGFPVRPLRSSYVLYRYYRHVATDDILYWTFVGLESSLAGYLLWPSVAAFVFSGLAACGFEYMPLHGFFLMN